MLSKFIILIFYSCFLLIAQNKSVPISGTANHHKIIKADYHKVNPQKVAINSTTYSDSIFTFEIHQITNYMTGYDLQSLGSPQQLWHDTLANTLNAVFTTSQEASTWNDRTCTYFYSSDEGVTWALVGNVPPPAPVGTRSGYPSIIGLSTGQIVISNHSNLGGGDVRTQLFINSAPGKYDFVNHDPGEVINDLTLYPILGVSKNDQIIFNGNGFVNTFNPNTNLFSGYNSGGGNQPGTYSFAMSDDGIVGMAYLDGNGGALLTETTDGGLTWTTPENIFEPYYEIAGEDTFLIGTLRGINLTYLKNTPKVVFEVVKRSPDLTGYYPELPSEIHFWSPDINSGDNFIIADSNNVPFFPNQGLIYDDSSPVCKPVIGKAIGDDDILYVAFTASIDEVANLPGSTRFYAGYFMLSENKGMSWSKPILFTPDSLNPPFDFRFISIAPINPLNDNEVKVHFVIEGDPTAGVLFPYHFPAVTAAFYHISIQFTLPVVSVKPDITSPSEFLLYQNYPNPFNPVTKIKFIIPQAVSPLLGEASVSGEALAKTGGRFVTLKVYDVLGREIAILFNEEKQPGVYEVEFDGSQVSSGVYFYSLTAGEFNQTKKMILVK